MNDLTESGIALSARDIQSRVNLIQEIMKKVMQDGTHYGIIPGCPKPSLYKAGAEKIAVTFQLSIQSSVEDLSILDEKRYRVTCDAFSASGVKLGSAVGECSSNEAKYKWRAPVCDAEYEATGVDRKRIKWERDGKEIKQVRTEPSDLANTILQMADKRAYVAVVRKVTASSDIFTQDIEDIETQQNAPAIQKPKPKIQAMDTADFKSMKSKYAGKCKSCEKDIAVGEDILFNPKIKGAVYHPACLVPSKSEPEAQPAEDLKAPAPKVILDNLEKLAVQAKVKLIDRIGRDGFETLEQITRGYANDLLAEFAEKIDSARKE